MKHKLTFLAVMLLCATALSAAPIITAPATGQFATAGGIRVTATLIDFTPPVNGGYGEFRYDSSDPATISYIGDTGPESTSYTQGQVAGQMKDVIVNSGVVTNFIQFYTPANTTGIVGGGTLNPDLGLDLLNFYIPSAYAGAPDCAVNSTVACRPLGLNLNTPFVFLPAGRNTFILLSGTMEGHDQSPFKSIWDIGFSTQYSGTIAQLYADFLADGVVVTSQSASMSVTQVIPEPSTYALMGAGLLALGWFGRRRKA